jgi:hypothetical protein
MKGITRTKAPPIEALEDYVRKVGLDRFSYVPGYKYGHFPLASSTAINRIAWGLARAQLRDKADVRPRTWFAKTFYQSINAPTCYSQSQLNGTSKTGQRPGKAGNG